jgi:hypothetical protein
MDIATKSTGDSMTAAEQNQVTDEIENALSSTGQTPSAADLFQLAKSEADYSAHGDFFTDSGAASAYVLTAVAPKQSPTAYSNGGRVRFVVGNTNTGASTVNVATLGVKSIKRVDGTALIAGDMTVGDTAILSYDGTDFLLLYTTADKTKIDEGLTFSETSAENAGVVTVLATSTLVTSVSFSGGVKNGDRISIEGIYEFTKGATPGIQSLTLSPSGGSTATIEFIHDNPTHVETTGSLVQAAAQAAINTSTILKVTGDGTLTLEMYGTSIGSNSTVAIGDGQLYAYFLRKQ